MPTRNEPAILTRLQSRFERRRPVRAGSLIVTLYGDAIAPRGGSLWLGSLNALLAPFGMEPGVVRTAMSRLVSDGLFERSRIGKSSYYRLSHRGGDEFAAAARHIYAGDDPAWSGSLELVVMLTTDARERQARRDNLAAAGYGQIAPNVMVRSDASRAADGGSAEREADLIVLKAASDDPADLQRLASSCWRLDKLASSYQSLLDDLGPPSAVERGLARLSDEAAFRLRILAIHEWRRIVLHDPRLPRALLPAGWPGLKAREVIAAIYRACSPGCERWLDAHAKAEQGSLPPPIAGASLRFRVPD